MSDPLASNSPIAPRLWPEGWACTLAGAAGGAVILVLIGMRLVDPIPGFVAIAAIAAAAAVLVWRVRAEARAVAAPEPESGVDVSDLLAVEGALEALPHPLMVITGIEPDDVAGGRVAFANAAARDSLRVQSGGGLLVTSVRIPEILEVVDEALFGRVSAEVAYETGGAQDRFCRALARPLPDGDGGLRRALLLITDETDARSNERMRSDFLANASHELRTPLASLTGFIETLRGHARDDAAARDKFLEIMAAQTDRMSRLVADLMSLSRIELNEHIPPVGEVDLGMAAMDVIDALAPQAQEAGVRIVPILPPRGGAVAPGDRDQILQVVQNLVDNGLKYAGRGGQVTVEVAIGDTAAEAVASRNHAAARLNLLAPDRSDDRYAWIRVTDTGPGIAREHLPRLTERFYRVEGQKSGERLGTGLGLAIVKHIVNRHRGGLAVETAKGAGCAFVAYFPCSPPLAPAVL